MLTMRPAIEHGRMTWDRRILPADEFDERRLAVDQLTAAAGLRALIGFDDAPTPGLVSYLTNYRGGLASVIAVPSVPATMLAGLGGGRDHPFIKSVSCVSDVRWFPALGDGVRTVLAEHGVDGGPIGLAGVAESLTEKASDQLLRSLDGFDVRHLDGEVASIRRRKSPRELVVLRRCTSIADQAGSVVTSALHDGRSLHDSLVAGERSARMQGCHDVRILASARYGELAPWPSAGPRQSTWPDGWVTVYLAVEYLGYWGETGFTVTRPDMAAVRPVPDAQPVLDRLRPALRAGATGAEVRAEVRAEQAAAGPDAGITVEIAGVGLRPAEAPLLTRDDSSAAQPGDAVNVRVTIRRGGVIGLATSLAIIQPKETDDDDQCRR